MDIISYALSKKGMQQSVSDYLDEHLTNPTNPPLDTSLTIANAAADSKATGDKLSELKEDLSDIENDIKNYPGKTRTITLLSSDFVQGYRHNQSGASIKTDSSYTTTNEVIHFKQGDVFSYSSGQDVQYFLVTTSGSFYETYVDSGFVLQETVDLYLDCKKTGITPSTTPSVQIVTSTIINNIIIADEHLQSQIDFLTPHYPVLEECQKQGDSTVKRGYRINDYGNETSTVDYLCCTTAIECSVGDVFLVINGYSVSRYNSQGTFTGNIRVANWPLYSGNERWNAWVSDTDGYVRFSLYWSSPVECAVTKLNLTEYPYTCVSLGDSIFGNNQKPNDLPTYMQKIDQLMSANCGFGGTMAATHYNPIYTPLSFWSIADAIYNEDWTDIDVDWNAINNDHVFMANVYILCHLIDWTKIKVVTIAYGTNDWNGDIPLDNANNKYDVTTYKGALRYGIEKIQSKYSHINIVLLSPLYRYWSNSQDYSTVDDDSDNRTVGGLRVIDFANAMQEVAEEYHLPYYDNYNTAGINKLTAPAILRDGTHLNYKYGVEMVGVHIGAEVAMSQRLY